MKNILRWPALFLAIAGLLLGIAHPTQARGGMRFPKEHKPPPKPVYTAIASVDTAAMTITTESKNAPTVATKTYKISPRVKITVNNQPATLADLRLGLQIRVGAGMDANVAEELSAQNPPPDPK